LVVRHEIEAVSIEEEGLAVVPHAKRTPERLSMFSDAVFAVLRLLAHH
jgi:hypothetical protein